MSLILCVWELGCSYGHMATFLPLALGLKNSGHNIIFALKDLSNAQMFLGGYGFSFLQAPTRSPDVAILSSSPPPVNYAEILLRFGFSDRKELRMLVHAWRKLYEQVQPELIIINHGPTALLSASGIEVPCVIIGSGFFSPPRVSPTPNMRPWLSIPHQRLIDSEQKVLAVANDILAELGASGLNTLAGLFKTISFSQS